MGSLAMATLLSAYQHFLTGSELAHARDRVRVFLGVLKAFTTIWPQARHWSEEIKLMARVVLERQDASGTMDISALQVMANIEGVSFISEVLEDVDVLDLGKNLGAATEGV
jgi:hypothetical protein